MSIFTCTKIVGGKKNPESILKEKTTQAIIVVGRKTSGIASIASIVSIADILKIISMVAIAIASTIGL